MKHTTALKVISVLAFSSFMMGNTKCQQQPVAERQLKKNVTLVDLSATTFLDNSGFSFSDVARNSFSGVLFERNDFFERTSFPTESDINGFNDQKYFGNQKLMSPASAKIMTQMQQWYPNQKSQKISFNRQSSCFMTRPQVLITGKINALEAYSGAALQLGLAIQNPLIPSASFKMDKMRLSLSFDAIDPWSLQKISSINAEAFKTDYKAGFGIDIGILHIGPEFYRSTGLAEVILSGLRKSTISLADDLLKKPGQEWSTRVIYNGDNSVVVLGGEELGLKAGDKLKVINETHIWNGEPCGASSILTGSVAVTDVNDPWIIEIEAAGTLISRGKVLNPKENDSIEVGALVKLASFAAPPAAVPPVAPVAKP